MPGCKSKKRVCKNCQSGEVEDVEHLMRYTSVAGEIEREKLLRLLIGKVTEWQSMDDT